MKRFLSVMLTAAMLTVGCNMSTTPSPQEDIGAWQAQIAPAMGIAMLAAGSPSPNTPVVNKVKRSQCTVCNGTGKIRTGDGISWTECDNCVPDGASHELTPEEINALRDSLKHMAALERYQEETEAWKRDHMEAFVLASVAKRKAATPQTNAVQPGTKLDGLAYQDVTTCGPNGCTTTRTYADGSTETIRSSSGAGSCSSGACGSSSSSGTRRGLFGGRGLFGWRRG